MTASKKYIQIQLTSQEEDGSEKDDRDRKERAAESLKSEIKIKNLKKACGLYTDSNHHSKCLPRQSICYALIQS